VFDGLLPDEHNDILLDLLFTLAVWHAYAKLRLHTDTTLAFFDTATSILGEQLRYFSKTTCEAFQTKETPSEVASRARRNAQKANSSGSGTTGAQQRGLNLSTYKLHALGHYPETIRRFGTTESYSTQTVSHYSIIQVSYYYLHIRLQGELQHHRAKRRFKRTNKRNFTKQIAQQDARERVVNKVQQRMKEYKERCKAEKLPDASSNNSDTSQSAQLETPSTAPRQAQTAVQFRNTSDNSSNIPSQPASPPAAPLLHSQVPTPQRHHHIASSKKSFLSLPGWLPAHSDDPALMVCYFLSNLCIRLSSLTIE